MAKVEFFGKRITPLVIPKKLTTAPMAELAKVVCLKPKFWKPMVSKIRSQSVFGLEAALLVAL